MGRIPRIAFAGIFMLMVQLCFSQSETMTLSEENVPTTVLISYDTPTSESNDYKRANTSYHSHTRFFTSDMGSCIMMGTRILLIVGMLYYSQREERGPITHRDLSRRMQRYSTE